MNRNIVGKLVTQHEQTNLTQQNDEDELLLLFYYNNLIHSIYKLTNL